MNSILELIEAYLPELVTALVAFISTGGAAAMLVTIRKEWTKACDNIKSIVTDQNEVATLRREVRSLTEDIRTMAAKNEELVIFNKDLTTNLELLASINKQLANRLGGTIENDQ